MPERFKSPEPDAGPDDYISPQEAAAILRVTTRTVAKYADDGLIDFYRLSKDRLYLRESVLAYAATGVNNKAPRYKKASASQPEELADAGASRSGLGEGSTGAPHAPAPVDTPT
jgi:excisionase family DNA binding protein